MKAAALAVLVILALAAPAGAQNGDVPGWISLIEKQPAGTDRLAWKEQRRDAAKKLGNSGDKRAVPVLIDLVENETFDIIGEIAIDGLGKLGDQRAVPVLEKVVADKSRDVGQRDAAKKALAKLGAKPQGSGDPDVEPDDPVDDGGLGRGKVDSVLTPRGDDPVASGPDWEDDVLGATEELTLALGTASFGWDSARRRGVFDLDVAGTYERTLDKEKMAYRYGGEASLLAAVDNPDERAKNILVLATAGGHGEFRGYTSSGVYGVGYGAVRLAANKLTMREAVNNGNDISDKWLEADIQVAIGGGYGRILEIGTRARVARIATALERARALGRPIDDNVAKKLQSAWWSLRGELGAHRRLTSTVAILREAGVLLGEPDAGTTYELLEILEDPAFDGRASGMDVDLAFGESYLTRSRDTLAPGEEDFVEGRLEEVLVRARFARQLGDESDAAAGLFARYRLFAPTGVPAPWAIGAKGRWRKFVYGGHFDPRGALDVGAELGLSDDDRVDTNVGLRVGGELGWTMLISRASSLRLSGALTLDGGEIFVGARLEAAYGFLDNAFALSR